MTEIRTKCAWLNVLVGMLLIIAPFGLSYYTLSNTAMYEAIVAGLLIGGLALWSATSTTVHPYVDYVIALLGLWSIAAPFVLGYHSTVTVARDTDIIAGIAVAVIALVNHFYVSPVSRTHATA